MLWGEKRRNSENLHIPMSSAREIILPLNATLMRPLQWCCIQVSWACVRGLLKIKERCEKILIDDSWSEEHISQKGMNGNQTIAFTMEKAEAI